MRLEATTMSKPPNQRAAGRACIEPRLASSWPWPGVPEPGRKCIRQPRQQPHDTMITSIHTLVYSDDPNATRAFLRDVLGWGCVAEDFDSDWLIFKSGPSELGVHPTHGEWDGKAYDFPRRHLIALMCDDIDTTVAELRARGARFRGPIQEQIYGRAIMMVVPGADDIQLYQPTHKLAYNL
jgi:catechol 2,3-dioxygenase-like lactoylglutathione lyase family enzyme